MTLSELQIFLVQQLKRVFKITHYDLNKYYITSYFDSTVRTTIIRY